MKKNSVVLKILLQLFALLSIILFILSVFSNNKRDVRRMIAKQRELAKIGSDFSMVEYNEKSTTKWGQRVYTIKGKIKFDEQPYRLESEINRSSIHPELITVKQIPNSTDFDVTIRKGNKNDHYASVSIYGQIVSHGKLKEIADSGIVIVDGQLAFDSGKNIEKLSDSLIKQRKNIEEHYKTVANSCQQFTRDFNTFKEEDFILLDANGRAEFLKEFETKLQSHSQCLSKEKQFYQELSFACKAPWNKFFEYPAEINKLVKEMDTSINKYEEICSNASNLLKNRQYTHQQIAAGRYKILNLQGAASSRTPQSKKARNIYPRSKRVNPKGTNNTSNANKGNFIASPEVISPDSDSIKLQINTL